MLRKPTLPEACRALGLRCRCEASHTEPRFTLELAADDGAPQLTLVQRDDGGVTHNVAHLDLEVPGLLLEVTEETVQREPVMNLWLPHTASHRYVLYRSGEQWRLGALPGLARFETVGEAVAILEKPR